MRHTGLASAASTRPSWSCGRVPGTRWRRPFPRASRIMRPVQLGSGAERGVQ